ncbi:hypothetical protein F4826_003084 [Rahnella inusitata]|nr:hypothetical protein [Rahnella inusitata]
MLSEGMMLKRAAKPLFSPLRKDNVNGASTGFIYRSGAVFFKEAL